MLDALTRASDGVPIARDEVKTADQTSPIFSNRSSVSITLSMTYLILQLRIFSVVCFFAVLSGV